MENEKKYTQRKTKDFRSTNSKLNNNKIILVVQFYFN